MDTSGKFPPLNLPQAELRIRPCGNGYEVWDDLRRKWLVLTPEEWVRRHFIEFLVGHRNARRELVAQEMQLSDAGGHTLVRADIVVYAPGCREPLMIVECKAPTVTLSQKTFDQIAQYNLPLGVRYLVVTNGLSHYCCEITAGGAVLFLPDIPSLE